MKSQWPTALLLIIWATGVATGISFGAWVYNGSDFIRYGSLVVVAFAYYQVITSIRSWRRRPEAGKSYW